jgi:hypothetical protein
MGLYTSPDLRGMLKPMKNLLPITLLIASAGLTQASIVETISFDLSTLHSGSTLSGTFTLPAAPIVGDTESVTLSFSDPSDYSVASLMGTIIIGSGTVDPYTVTFDPLTFTNPSGNMFTKNIDLMPAGAAQCASFPCTANGRFEDGNPAAFTAMYSVTAAPEPNYGLLLPVLAVGLALLARRV